MNTSYSEFDYLYRLSEEDPVAGIAELVAKLPGSIDQNFRRLGEVFDTLARTTKTPAGKSRPTTELFHLAKIAFGFPDPDLSDLERANKALETWNKAHQFVHLKKIPNGLFVYKGIIHPQAKWNQRVHQPSDLLDELVESMNLSSITTLETWLKTIMPTREKKSERWKRLRQYFSNVKKNTDLFNRCENHPLEPDFPTEVELFECISRRVTEVRGLFSEKCFNSPKSLRNEILKAETLNFLAWDKFQTDADRKSKAQKAAAAMWKKVDEAKRDKTASSIKKATKEGKIEVPSNRKSRRLNQNRGSSI